MIDILDGQGKKINVDKLSYHLGVPVVATSALKQTGVDQVVKKAAHTTTSTVGDLAFPIYDDRLEAAFANFRSLGEIRCHKGLRVFMPLNSLNRIL